MFFFVKSKKKKTNVRVVNILSTVQTNESMQEARQLVNKEVTDATNESIR